MTDSTDPRQPDSVFDGASDAAPRPYQAPQLDELGAIHALTAGPNDGSLDQLGGSSGGFLIADGTS